MGKGLEQIVVMEDPSPYHRVVSTQQQTPHSHPSRGNHNNNLNHEILMTREDILM